MSDAEFVCRHCGSDALVAWYKVWERQDVSVYDHPEYGLQVNYDGCTSTGDADEDEEYRCRGCDACVPADRLGELVVRADRFIRPAELARILGNLP